MALQVHDEVACLDLVERTALRGGPKLKDEVTFSVYVNIAECLPLAKGTHRNLLQRLLIELRALFLVQIAAGVNDLPQKVLDTVIEFGAYITCLARNYVLLT